jgi:transposase-like protein
VGNHLSGNRPKAQIAGELGIRVNQFRKWKLEFEQEERTGAQSSGWLPIMTWTGCDGARLAARKKTSF